MHKRKILTQIEKNSLKTKHKEYNKRLRTQYMHKSQLTFEDFVDYLQGYYKKTIKTQPLKRYQIPIQKSPEIIQLFGRFIFTIYNCSDLSFVDVL